MTAYEVIQLKVFDCVRDHIKEKALLKMRQNDYKVFLDIDEEDAFDYENPLNSKFGIDDLMKTLFEEIEDFEKQKEEWDSHEHFARKKFFKNIKSYYSYNNMGLKN